MHQRLFMKLFTKVGPEEVNAIIFFPSLRPAQIHFSFFALRVINDGGNDTTGLNENHVSVLYTVACCFIQIHAAESRPFLYSYSRAQGSSWASSHIFDDDTH